MSSPSPNNGASSKNSAINGAPKALSEVELEAAPLQRLLVQVQDVPDNMADEDIAALLQRLEQADGIGKDMEGRLDAILQNLDSLLGALEPEATKQIPVEQPEAGRTGQGGGAGDTKA
ncbi:hypothetical protein K488DRAFT_87201 [Vararia minispora EC-137]|uniref:Uncharacterized protein n=1 Tax=Vararia minispora EC-137 TaxID=1314806 RepID=A0ACB8QIA3_9AGAM|nr:hypothetical protein K488DRAFT_87201 [Vararia minispora EC-137]